MRRDADRGSMRSSGRRAAVTVLVFSMLALGLSSVGAAPGETWSGTLRITEERSSVSSDPNGNVTGSFSRLHTTGFSVSSIPGVDDDEYVQPLSGWDTSLDQRENSNGRCPSHRRLIGEATGTDGRLEITVNTGGALTIEVLDFGSTGQFTVTERSQTCQDNQEQVSSTTFPHHSFSVQTTGDPEAHELSGSFVQQLSDGTITYEWDLVRAEEPTDGDDNLEGTDGADLIELLGGNDVYSGGAGDDKVYGGTGDDEIAGQGNSDLLVGGDGSDLLSGGRGPDVIKGDGPNGISRSEALRSGDYSASAGSPDLLFGNGGRDRLVGGAGFDRFRGGRGKDVCIVNTRKEKRLARGCEVVHFRRANR